MQDSDNWLLKESSRKCQVNIIRQENKNAEKSAQTYDILVAIPPKQPRR